MAPSLPRDAPLGPAPIVLAIPLRDEHAAAAVPESVRFLLGTGGRIGECLGELWLAVDLGVADLRKRWARGVRT